ncbi:MAG: pilus assembly protein PilM [bacterium]
MKRNYSVIGLDIASDRIRLLQLRWQKESLSIHQASQTVLDCHQDEKGLTDALRNLLSRGKYKGNQVMAALPNSLVTTIPIKFTLKEGEGTDQAILREARNYLSFPLENGVIDYLNLPASDQRSQQTKVQTLAALLMAAQREDILKYLNLFKAAGLEASVIEPRYCALFRAIQWAQQGEPLKDQFVFSLEENDAMFMVLVDEQILVVRELNWGINAIKERVGNLLGLKGGRVNHVLRYYGVDPGRGEHPGGEKTDSLPGEGDSLWRSRCQVITEVLSPALEDFCQEIQKVLSYCVSMVQQRVIDRALLIGEGSMIRGLDQFIQQRTGIHITVWHDVPPVKELEEAYPFFEVALGLALRGIKSSQVSKPLSVSDR